MDATLILLGAFAGVFLLAALLRIRYAGDMELVEHRAAAAWRHARWTLPPVAAVVLAGAALYLFWDVPTSDCATDRFAPGLPTGYAAGSAVALMAAVACAPVAFATAAVAAALRNAPDDTYRKTAYWVSGTVAWMAAKLAWPLPLLGVYALVRYPDFAAAC